MCLPWKSKDSSVTCTGIKSVLASLQTLRKQRNTQRHLKQMHAVPGSPPTRVCLHGDLSGRVQHACYCALLNRLYILDMGYLENLISSHILLWGDAVCGASRAPCPAAGTVVAQLSGRGLWGGASLPMWVTWACWGRKLASCGLHGTILL